MSLHTQTPSPANSPASQTLPSSLDQQLRRFRNRLRILKLVEVVMLAITALVVGYLVVFVIERFVAIESVGRAAILIVSTLGFSAGIPLAVRKWFWNTRRPEQVGRLLRNTFPVLGDEILTVIEMADRQTGQGASPRLMAAATEQIRSRVATKKLAAAAPTVTASKYALIAVTAAGLASVLIAAAPTAAGNSWQRFLSPWTDTPRFTFTKLGEVPEQLVVPYGEAFHLDIPLVEHSQWKPENATAAIGSSKVFATIENDVYRFSVPAQTDDAEFSVAAGDDSRSLDIKPTTRPEVTSIVANTTLPSYLQYEESVEQTLSGRRFHAIAGSKVTFNFHANRELESATLDGAQIQVNGQYVSTAPMEISESRQHVVNWRDLNDLRPRKPIKLEIDAIEDQAPSVVFSQLKERVLLEAKSVRFEFIGRDDFGIRKVGLEWVGQSDADDDTVARGEKILFAGGPQKLSVDGRGIFSPKLENIAPQILTLRLFVEDYLPSRKRIYSRPQSLHVMSHDDHVAWINENMQRWKSKADDIYEHEIGLAEENLALRRMDQDEQRAPDSLRRMENQAAAERDNAQRLQQAVDEGRDLIEQALMNENLRADQVSKWAQSLARLQKIAESDMPGIADQLNQIKENLRNDSQRGGNSSNSDPDGSNSDQNLNLEPSNPSESGQPSDVENGGYSADEPPLSAGRDFLKAQGQGRGESDGKEECKEEESKQRPPSLRNDESSMLDRSDDSDSEQPGEAGNTGNFGVPETRLLSPKLENEEQDDEQPASEETEQPAESDLDEVIEDHKKLLEEFRDAREEMDDVMAEFENSTFVKRLKAASRWQLDVASRLNELMPRAFGDSSADDARSRKKVMSIVDSQQNLFESLQRLKTDLEAYQTREPEDARQRVLEDMGLLKMQVKLEELPKRMIKNRLGDSLHRSEFWADTFDRWAEEMVPPVNPNGSSGSAGGGENPNLPPAIVLEVMRQIEDEMNLRDETRTFELAHDAMSPEEQQQRKDGLTVHQMEIQERSLDTIEDIQQLPQDFGREVSKVTKAAMAMHEATGMLFGGTTGDLTLAAETAAIEALLASSRSELPSNDENQENTSREDGSESLAGDGSAMGLLNPARELTRNTPRDVGAGVSANRENIPERFRRGIDSFTNRLDRLRRNKNK